MPRLHFRLTRAHIKFVGVGLISLSLIFALLVVIGGHHENGKQTRQQSRRVVRSTQRRVVHFTFVSENYQDKQVFYADVERFGRRLLTYEPYKSRASQIVFDAVYSTDDFGCRNGAFRGQRYDLSCDSDSVDQAVVAAGASTNFITLLSDRDFNGLDGQKLVYYPHMDGTDGWVHEAGGHQFGLLMDEYVYGAGEGLQTQVGPIDNQVHRLAGQSGDVDFYPVGDGNCYAGIPPAAVWSGLVAATDYKLGCSYSNWYASAQHSIMNDWTSCFDKVSQALLNKRIDQFAGALPGGDPVPVACDQSTDPPNTIGPTPAIVKHES